MPEKRTSIVESRILKWADNFFAYQVSWLYELMFEASKENRCQIDGFMLKALESLDMRE